MTSKLIINQITKIIYLSVVLISFESLEAQPQRRQMPDSTQIAIMVDSLGAKLSLSDSVKSKVSEIYFASFDTMEKMLAENRGGFMTLRGARKKEISKRDDEINVLLSDEQKQVFEKMTTEERKRREERMRHRRGRRQFQ